MAKSVPGPDDRPRLVAFVAPADPAAPPGDDDLIALLRSSVPEFMVPSRFVHLPEFPVTANGKIDYAALGNPYRRGEPTPAAPRPHDEPRARAESRAHDVPRPERIAVLAAAAARLGLDVTVSVTQGRLAPADALTAAATWAREALAAGVGGTPRLSPDGLVAVDLAVDLAAARAPGAPPPPPTPPPGEALDAADPEIEQAITDVLSGLLKTRVDPVTPFLRLGATSLTLVLAHRHLSTGVAPDLSVVDLFAHPTVRDLARHITRQRTAPPAVEPVAPVGSDDPAERRRAAPARAVEVAR